MTTEVTTAVSFEQRMKDRIRESIGELISDEELQKMVHRGVEEVFFKPGTKKINPGSWQEKTVETPAWSTIKYILPP